MPDPELIPVESIKRLDVSPGDMLIVTLADHIGDHARQRMEDVFHDHLPAGVKVFFVRGIDMQVVTPKGGVDR